jgi:predicted GTPase
MGYGQKQIEELEKTINASPAELVVIGTPIDLRRVIKIDKPALRVRYDLEEIGNQELAKILEEF